MDDAKITLIQEGVVLDFVSDAPITVAGKKKLKCTLYARHGELIFLHKEEGLSFFLKILKFGMMAVLVGAYFFSDLIDLDESKVKMLLYAGFGIYAILPKILKRKEKELTQENLETFDFEGIVTRVYWRDLISVQAPKRIKLTSANQAEFNQGHQRILAKMSEESFREASAIANGDVLFADDESI
jgi:hypothetical protein